MSMLIDTETNWHKMVDKIKILKIGNCFDFPFNFSAVT